MKKCPVCKIEKPFDSFAILNIKKGSGRRSICDICFPKRKIIIERYYKKNHSRICNYCNKNYVHFTRGNNLGFCSYECRLKGSVHIDDETFCWNWLGCKRGGGYGSLRYKGKNSVASRVSYTIFKGEIPENIFVLHKCDNPSCINPDHLWLGTIKDNVDDAVKKGRVSMKGIKNRFCKLNNIQIKELFLLREEGKKYSQLSRIFNISEGHLRKIIKKKSRNNELDIS